MKALLLALVLTTPAIAQSINPVEYGERYCLLRKLKIDSATARKAAVEYSYDRYRSAANSKEDISAAARYVVTNCPDD
jgi:hypothetical protein